MLKITLMVIGFCVSNSQAADLNLHKGDVLTTAVQGCDTSEYGEVFAKFTDGQTTIGATCLPKICRYTWNDPKWNWYTSHSTWTIELQPDNIVLGKNLTRANRDTALNGYLKDKICKKLEYYDYDRMPSF